MASLFPWLEDWKLELQGWARDGSLTRAAQEALNLDAVPPALQRLVGLSKEPPRGEASSIEPDDDARAWLSADLF